MMVEQKWREMSKKPWKCTDVENLSDDEAIRRVEVGSLQRIADALELMTKDKRTIESESRDLWRKRVDYLNGRVEKLDRSNAALRGVITKLKRKGK